MYCRAVVLLLLVALAGCTRTRTIVRYKPVEVLVPVPVPPTPPPIIERPMLPLMTLKANSPAVDVARSYVASIILLMGYARELEILLDAYRPVADSTIRRP